MKQTDHRSHIGPLHDLLREVRREKDLTQTEMAALLSQSQSFVSKYESGERILNLLEIRVICKCLGITLVEFCLRLEEKIASQESADQ